MTQTEQISKISIGLINPRSGTQAGKNRQGKGTILACKISGHKTCKGVKYVKTRLGINAWATDK